MAVGLQRSGDGPATRHIGRCASPPANHRCAVGLLPLPRQEFRLLKLILHSELRRRAATRRALPCTSSCLWTKVHRTFFMECGRNRCRSHFFQILDFWSRSRDIRDQIRKLSKIALNFGRYFRSPKGSRPTKSYTHVMAPASRHVVWKMFCEDTPTSLEVIVANTPNFKISPLIFFGGGTPPNFGCALSRLGQSL